MDERPLRIGSLFAGIGGLELGLEQAGLGHTVWQVERDPYASAVLAAHWPDAVRYDDICDVGRGRKHEPESVDILCGGFPCQDISLAGKGAGLEGDRSGLWFEYLRLIGEIRPRLVVAENVSALRARGLEVVLGGLAALGYDAEWDCIPASYVGAPHRRDRIWIVAYPVREPESESRHEAEALGGERVARLVAGRGGDRLGVANAASDVAYPVGQGAEPQRSAGDVSGAPRDNQAEGDQRQRGGDAARDRREDVADGGRARLEGHAGDGGAAGREAEGGSTAAAGLCGGEDAAGWWDVEPDVGRVAHGVPRRVDRLRCLGNACVPQVAAFVGRLAIERGLISGA